MSIKDEVKERLVHKIVDWYEHSPRRVYILIKPQDLKEVAKYLFRELGFRFSTASGLDTPQGIEILYHFSFDQAGMLLSVRVLIEDKKNPQIDSLVPLLPAAEWIEREIWEMLGVKFIGHPNLKHLLLIDDWPEAKFPLRHKNES